MSEHIADIHWQRGDVAFSDGKYSRDHVWRFEGGTEVAASAAPGFAPPPLGTPEHVDPEEAFVASLSSCHMLWFLHLAQRAGFPVADYRDAAVGTLATNSGGQMAMTRVVLRPRVRWGQATPDDNAHRCLHDDAHHRCFIANSVRSEIVVEAETVG